MWLAQHTWNRGVLRKNNGFSAWLGEKTGRHRYEAARKILVGKRETGKQ